MRHTTRELHARIDRIDYRWDVETQSQEPADESLQMNDIARVAIALGEPLFADRYEQNAATGSFILIDPADNNTVAAGMIR
jgi:sulfate adenylyltransferase subunit 1